MSDGQHPHREGRGFSFGWKWNEYRGDAAASRAALCRPTGGRGAGSLVLMVCGTGGYLSPLPPPPPPPPQPPPFNNNSIAAPNSPRCSQEWLNPLAPLRRLHYCHFGGPMRWRALTDSPTHRLTGVESICDLGQAVAGLGWRHLEESRGQEDGGTADTSRCEFWPAALLSGPALEPRGAANCYQADEPLPSPGLFGNRMQNTTQNLDFGRFVRYLMIQHFYFLQRICTLFLLHWKKMPVSFVAKKSKLGWTVKIVHLLFVFEQCCCMDIFKAA